MHQSSIPVCLQTSVMCLMLSENDSLRSSEANLTGCADWSFTGFTGRITSHHWLYTELDWVSVKSPIEHGWLPVPITWSKFHFISIRTSPCWSQKWSASIDWSEWGLNHCFCGNHSSQSAASLLEVPTPTTLKWAICQSNVLNVNRETTYFYWGILLFSF